LAGRHSFEAALDGGSALDLGSAPWPGWATSAKTMRATGSGWPATAATPSGSTPPAAAS